MPLYTSDSLCDDGGPGAECNLHLRHRLRRLRPAIPASSANLRAETCNWASDANCNDCGPGSEFRPAPGRRHVYHCRLCIVTSGLLVR